MQDLDSTISDGDNTWLLIDSIAKQLKVKITVLVSIHIENKQT